MWEQFCAGDLSSEYLNLFLGDIDAMSARDIDDQWAVVCGLA